MNRLNKQKHQRTRGMSLVETLISLTISVTLLVAVGATWSSVATSIESNDKHYRATQSARVTMNSFLAEVRRCADLQKAHDIFGAADNSTSFRLTTSPVQLSSGTQNLTQRDLEWRFVAANTTFVNPFDNTVVQPTVGQMKLIDWDNSKVFTIASNLKGATFHVQRGTNNAGQEDFVQVSLSITAQVGNETVFISGSAVPRQFYY